MSNLAELPVAILLPSVLIVGVLPSSAEMVLALLLLAVLLRLLRAVSLCRAVQVGAALASKMGLL